MYTLLASALPLLSLATTCSLKHTSDGSPPFDDEAMAKIRKYWLANINVDDSGAIIASPDPHAEADCPGLKSVNNYVYHWARDSALTMHALLFAGDVPDADHIFYKYVEWEKKIHDQPDAHKGVNILAEPKFFLNGSARYPFYSTCMRPQNDGPGLRGKVISEYALAFEPPAETQRSLYEFVQRDLDYLLSVWQNPTCEPWEEVNTADAFFDRFAMRACLTQGSRFAKKLGHDGDAAKYQEVADKIASTLANHYNKTGKFVYEDTTLVKSHIDAAVIEAFNDFYDNDGFFAPLNHEVLNTIIAYNEAFCNEYPINAIDNEAGLPGIMYGRYLQDGYCGGNPWVLLTAALAEHTYSTASALLKVDSVSAETYELLQKAYGVDDGLEGKELADAVMGAADGVLLRLKHHVKVTDYHMREQISRNDGHQLSAKDLTWSYSNVIKAMHARKLYMAEAADSTKMSAVRSSSISIPVAMSAALLAAAAITFVKSVTRKPQHSSTEPLLHDAAVVPA